MVRQALGVAAIVLVLVRPGAAFEEPCKRGIADVTDMLPTAAVGRQTQAAVLRLMERSAAHCRPGQEQEAQRLTAAARMMLVSENWEYIAPMEGKAEELRAVASGDGASKTN